MNLLKKQIYDNFLSAVDKVLMQNLGLKLVKKFLNIEPMFPDSGCRKAILLWYSAYQLAGAFMELEFFFCSAW